MEFFKTNHNVISIAIFLILILITHIFAINNYDWTKNTISNLGSQSYDRKLIDLL